MFDNDLKPYPAGPGYARDSETSRVAAERLTSHEAIYDTCLQFILDAGHYGATVDDAWKHCEAEHRKTYDRTTIGARFTKMLKDGKIVKTELTRPTRHDRPATVHIHTNFIEKQGRLF